MLWDAATEMYGSIPSHRHFLPPMPNIPSKSQQGHELPTLSVRSAANVVRQRLTPCYSTCVAPCRLPERVFYLGRRLRGGLHGDNGFPVEAVERRQHPGPRGQRGCWQHAKGGGSVSCVLKLAALARFVLALGGS